MNNNKSLPKSSLPRKYCGSVFVGTQNITYYAEYITKSKNNLPLFGIVEEWANGYRNLYGTAEYRTLDEAYHAGCDMVDRKNYN